MHFTIKNNLKCTIHVKQWQPQGMTSHLKIFKDIIHFETTLYCLISVGYHLELHIAITFTNIIVFYHLSVLYSLVYILTTFIIWVKNDTPHKMI